jgi:hypothetical protein
MAQVFTPARYTYPMNRSKMIAELRTERESFEQTILMLERMP